MSSMNDDDQPLASLLSEWQTETPPEAFASTVVRVFESERRASGLRRAPRGVVIPLLLAAAFISLGAAAAFSERALRSVESGQEQTDETPVKAGKAPRVSFYGTFESARAEPDSSITPARIVRAENPARALSEEVEEVAPPAAETPRVVHFPRCECGTSGVVCTCSD